MKQRVAILLLSSSSMLFLAATARAADVPDVCLQQRADILKQIDHAKQHGNNRQVAGLNKALREQKAHCTPESIRKAREQDVAEARQNVAARERELQDAKSEGKDAGKIAKRQAKLKEAQHELARAQKVLGN